MIRALLHQGYTVEIGPHGKGLRGYWASFTDNRDASSNPRKSWDRVGHGNTPHQAMQMATKISLDAFIGPPIEEFEL